MGYMTHLGGYLGYFTHWDKGGGFVEGTVPVLQEVENNIALCFRDG